jgi:single-strand DNA-binding protein
MSGKSTYICGVKKLETDMASLNKVVLIGYVGQDPKTRYFDSGNSVANFTVATSDRGYKLPNGTEVPERTEWHNIVANRTQAQFVEKHVKKGASVYVEGKIRTRSYDDQNGVKRYMTEILADKVEFFPMGSRRQDGSGEDGGASGGGGGGNQQSYGQQPQSQGSSYGSSQPSHAGYDEPPVMSASSDADDLPF